jgi:hypothetical protein
LANGRIHPHILIDAHPRFRQRLELESSRDELPPLLLSLDPARSRYFDSVSPKPLPDTGTWSLASRVREFVPARLILESRSRPTRRPDPRGAWEEEGLADEMLNLWKLFGEARDYFGLGPKEYLRIACVGDQYSLFPKSRLLKELPAEWAYRQSVGPRRHAQDLASLLTQFPNVRLEWLADGYRGRSPAREEFLEGWPTWRHWRVARRVRAEIAGHPIFAVIAGSLAFVYIKVGRSWRPMWAPDEYAPEIIRLAMAAMPRTRRRFLVLAAPRPADNECKLDNPILTDETLRLAALTRIDAVLVDRRLAVFCNDNLPEGAEETSVRSPGGKPLVLPRIFRI